MFRHLPIARQLLDGGIKKRRIYFAAGGGGGPTIQTGSALLLGNIDVSAIASMLLSNRLEGSAELLVSTTPSLTIGGRAIIDSEAELLAAPKLLISGKSVVDGELNANIFSRLTINGSSRIDGSIDLILVPKLIIGGSLNNAGDLSATAIERLIHAASFTGDSELISQFESTIRGQQRGSATLQCELVAIFNPTISMKGSSVISGELESSFIASRTIHGVFNGSMEASLQMIINRIIAGSCVLNIESILNSSGKLIINPRLSLDSSLESSFLNRTILGGNASLNAESELILNPKISMSNTLSLPMELVASFIGAASVIQQSTLIYPFNLYLMKNYELELLIDKIKTIDLKINRSKEILG